MISGIYCVNPRGSNRFVRIKILKLRLLIIFYVCKKCYEIILDNIFLYIIWKESFYNQVENKSDKRGANAHQERANLDQEPTSLVHVCNTIALGLECPFFHFLKMGETQYQEN